jgi:hypothetical protein
MDRANAWRHTKALNPVMALPTISRVHLPGALIGIDRLGIGDEASDVVLKQD